MANSTIKLIGLSNPTFLAADDDMDNLSPGVYYQNGSYSLPANAPSAKNAAVLVLRGRTSDIFQIWISNNERKIYFRAKYVTWSPWQTLFSWSVS